MHTKTLYIPIDRCQALLREETLPEHTVGAALFADISGFTPLTEALARALGPRHGAEELTHHLNNVYDVLIAQVNRFGGSVIGFSGDAITCWFADDYNKAYYHHQKPQPAARRAVAAALAMQEGMKAFSAIAIPGGEMATLAMKAAVASGPARRFVVGDPAVQLIDTLVGETVVRMATAEHLANRGDVIIDQATADALGTTIEILEWRQEKHENTHNDHHLHHHEAPKFAAVKGFHNPLEDYPWTVLNDDSFKDTDIRAWVLRPINERLNSGESEAVTELRPAVALFLRFLGLDYDKDPDAGKKLDSYIRHVQKIVSRYEGFLIQLTIGDKGSYLYASFGGLITHEDDPRRAIGAALELRATPDELDFVNHVQIGISQGLMRVGTYGGTTRHTYGVLGDDVNLAARLMQHAGAGDVLASRRVQKNAQGPFSWETLPAIRVKGKSEPVPLFRAMGKQTATGPGSNGYATAMVGRDNELSDLIAFTQPIFEGKFAGVTIVYGEAGMGKSRLIAELHTRITSDTEKIVSWFFCPAEQLVHQSLYPFRHFLREYFAHDAEASDEENKDRFDEVFDALLDDLRLKHSDELADDLEEERSILAALVEIFWDGSLYDQIEPQLRHESMLLAVRAFLEAESLRHPVILQLEDLHWFDHESHELIRLLTSDTENYPVAVLCTSRYLDDGSHVKLNVESNITFKIVDLNQLSPEGARQMAAQTLKGAISDGLTTTLMEKTHGNPFYLEQMTLDLQERGLLIQDAAGAFAVDPTHTVEIPNSINAVLIARLDRLMSEVKNVVQTASVLGHEFDAAVLLKMFQSDEHLLTKVKHAEAQAIWAGMNELHYFFRHALLRDAAYDMQIRARLRQLHRLAGTAIEEVHANDLAAYYAELVYHFNKAEDVEFERRYVLLAAEHANAEAANEEALEYYSRGLELIPETDMNSRFKILMAREHLYDLMGNRSKQNEDINTLRQYAEQLDDDHKRAEVSLRRVHYDEVTNNYDDAIEASRRIITLGKADGIRRDEALGYLWLGRSLMGKNNYAEAEEYLHKALNLAISSSLDDLEADALRELGMVANHNQDYEAAQENFQKAITFYQKVNFRRGECKTLNNLGSIALLRQDYPRAHSYLDQALCICHQIGYRHAEVRVLSNLGKLAVINGDATKAHGYFVKAVHIAHEIGDQAQEKALRIELEKSYSN